MKDKQAYIWFDHAKDEFKKGNLKQASELLSQAIEEQAREAAFYGLTGELALYEGDYKKAEADLDFAIQLNNDYYAFYLNRGLAKKELKDYYGSEKDLKKSLQLLPTALGHYTLGQLFFKKGLYDQAKNEFIVLAKLDTDLGLKARKWLTRMDLPNHPEKYLRISFAKDSKKRLAVFVENTSILPISHLEIQISYRYLLKDGKYVIGNKSILFAETIPANKMSKKVVEISPLINTEDLNTAIDVKILKACTPDEQGS